jgi:APA family basic amino acid/polyamine antiporter
VAVYAFAPGTSPSVIALRFTEPDVARPNQVVGYPVTPLIFRGVCALLIYSSLNCAGNFKPKSLMVLAAMLVTGLLVYGLTEALPRRAKARNFPESLQ